MACGSHLGQCRARVGARGGCLQWRRGGPSAEATFKLGQKEESARRREWVVFAQKAMGCEGRRDAGSRGRDALGLELQAFLPLVWEPLEEPTHRLTWAGFGPSPETPSGSSGETGRLQRGIHGWRQAWWHGVGGGRRGGDKCGAQLGCIVRLQRWSCCWTGGGDEGRAIRG